VSDERRDLARRLEELHAELARTRSVDDASRELLEDVRRDIESVLERSDSTRRDSLRGRLEAAIEHFQTSHPVLTETMGRVMDQLANLGI
jgi:hypothetical protein